MAFAKFASEQLQVDNYADRDEFYTFPSPIQGLRRIKDLIAAGIPTFMPERDIDKVINCQRLPFSRRMEWRP